MQFSSSLASLASSLRVCSFCLPEGVERLAIVDEKVEAWRARRELGGMPSAYYVVSIGEVG